MTINQWKEKTLIITLYRESQFVGHSSGLIIQPNRSFYLLTAKHSLLNEMQPDTLEVGGQKIKIKDNSFSHSTLDFAIAFLPNFSGDENQITKLPDDVTSKPDGTVIGIGYAKNQKEQINIRMLTGSIVSEDQNSYTLALGAMEGMSGGPIVCPETPGHSDHKLIGIVTEGKESNGMQGPFGRDDKTTAIKASVISDYILKCAKRSTANKTVQAFSSFRQGAKEMVAKAKTMTPEECLKDWNESDYPRRD